ncbi:3'-5' exonuclease [Flavobacterium sp. TMP13]|uniref:3'-5' exonuclease n=1 Tax=Flavobacterium sp. TMP13 TaxID=3425950 RepID=UPI003D76C24E
MNSKKTFIQKALLTELLGKKVVDLEFIDFNQCVEQFTNYLKTWEKDGVFVALNQLVVDFKVVEIHQKDTTKVHRVLSNVRQLLELLQEKELNNALTPNEVYLYLYHQTKSLDSSENADLSQRIESDEDAVKIVTIHKSKGLEYDVILTPYLDLLAKEMFYFSSIRIENNENQDYVFVRNPIQDSELKEIFIHQKAQENIRLLYVALTRAKYNAILINKSNNQYNKRIKHNFSAFINEIENQDNFQSENIIIKSKEEIDNWGLESVSLNKKIKLSVDKIIPKISFADANYNKMSYSFLSAHGASSPKENLSVYDALEYNHFIFKDLQKGAQIGNLLHAIFEFIDYTNSDNWEAIIRNAVRSFAPSKLDDVAFFANLYSLVTFTMQVNLGSDTDGNLFSLQSISKDKRVNELEFNFSLPNDFNMASLEYLLQDEERQIETKRNGEVQGMMLGFIDLFFEHKGKYYILDWKSNFLGDTLAHYDEVNVLKAMNESNYHLQYLIYAVAVNKFLTSKIPNFDFESQFGGVIYLFLRGVRENQSSGVYFQKVTLDEVERMGNIFNSEFVVSN